MFIQFNFDVTLDVKREILDNDSDVEGHEFIKREFHFQQIVEVIEIKKYIPGDDISRRAKRQKYRHKDIGKLLSEIHLIEDGPTQWHRKRYDVIFDVPASAYNVLKDDAV